MPSPSPGVNTPSSSGNRGPKLRNDYQLGDCLGKGPFSRVYRALNRATGETVAIKEIPLTNVPKGETSQFVASKIDLLRNLDHPNIVKYKGFFKTRDFLYIVLEFCENGSLHAICKRFGKFSENLVAVYICQVLEGLVYLHDQGVIHRDIKGTNIFTNKDGCAKLADFGVAANTTTAARDDAVVGSPYWMAPEVIELSGATSASDIWSVGCVVIELLEGEPPYHFLDPMPALFRIVQDDCPPIPQGALPIVKDFLHHCFQKDPNLRISAKKLLRHPWMVQARKQLKVQQGTPSATDGRRPHSNYNFDDAVLKVQEWNEALRSPPRPSKRLPPKSYYSPPSPHSPNMDTKPLISTEIHEPTALHFEKPEEQTDNWDDDFEEGISLAKLQALDKRSSIPLANPPPVGVGPIVEDLSDPAIDEDNEISIGKVANFRDKNPSSTDEDLQSVSSDESRPQSRLKQRPQAHARQRSNTSTGGAQDPVDGFGAQKIWYPPPPAYEEEDHSRVRPPQLPVPSLHLNTRSPDEWRKYPNFPAAYPLSPVQGPIPPPGFQIVVPVPTRPSDVIDLGNMSNSGQSDGNEEGGNETRPGFHRSLLSSRESQRRSPDEWRKYPNFPAAYPLSPVQGPIPPPGFQIVVPVPERPSDVIDLDNMSNSGQSDGNEEDDNETRPGFHRSLLSSPPLPDVKRQSLGPLFQAIQLSSGPKSACSHSRSSSSAGSPDLSEARRVSSNLSAEFNEYAETVEEDYVDVLFAKPSGPAPDAPIHASLDEPAWKHLTSRAFLPHEVIPLIEAILTSENEVKAIGDLCGDDAQNFIDVIHQALDLPDLQPRLRRKCLHILCRICGRRALLPKSLQIPLSHNRSDIPLYRGGYADVWKGEHQGCDVAVKVLRIYSTSDFGKVTTRFCKEVVTWNALRHPNVLPLVGVMMGSSQFAMVSEWMANGNINEFIKAHRDANRFELLKDVIRGLIYMHGQAMVHGDLKGANILIDEGGHARLADFGLLTLVSDPMTFMTSGSLVGGGTTRWMSPELLSPDQFGLDDSRPTTESDCYALGMVIYEVLSGQTPFMSLKDFVVMRKVVDGERPARPEGTKGVWFTDDLWGTMELCWATQPDSRPNIATVFECLEHISSDWMPLSPQEEENVVEADDDDWHFTLTN